MGDYFQFCGSVICYTTLRIRTFCLFCNKWFHKNWVVKTWVRQTTLTSLSVFSDKLETEKSTNFSDIMRKIVETKPIMPDYKIKSQINLVLTLNQQQDLKWYKLGKWQISGRSTLFLTKNQWWKVKTESALKKFLKPFVPGSRNFFSLHQPLISISNAFLMISRVFSFSSVLQIHKREK